MSSWIANAAAALVCLLALSGCGSAAMLSSSGGYVQPFRSSAGDQAGASADIHVGFGAAGGGATTGIGAALRSRLGDSFNSVSLAPELYFATGPADLPILAFFRGGVSLAQFEWLNSELQFGMFSPHVELGGMWLFAGSTDARREGLALLVTAGFEYDLRFTGDSDNEAAFTVSAGLAYLLPGDPPEEGEEEEEEPYRAPWD